MTFVFTAYQEVSLIAILFPGKNKSKKDEYVVRTGVPGYCVFCYLVTVDIGEIMESPMRQNVWSLSFDLTCSND